MVEKIIFVSVFWCAWRRTSLMNASSKFALESRVLKIRTEQMFALQRHMEYNIYHKDI